MSGPTLSATAIPGLFEIEPFVAADARGVFIKTFVASDFAAAGVAVASLEEYHTRSRRGVIRGMHFQLPPHDHDKTVFCTQGSAFDVVIDLRVGSPAFGKALVFELRGAECRGLHIPRGCAHGFAALEDETVLTYKVTTEWNPSADSGILWSSVPVEWPFDDPITSARDAALTPLPDFVSPFVFEGCA